MSTRRQAPPSELPFLMAFPALALLGASKAARAVRVRMAILDASLSQTRISAGPETYGEAFERCYGEALVIPGIEGVTRPPDCAET